MLTTMMIALTLQAVGPTPIPIQTSVPTSTGRTLTSSEMAPGAAGLTEEELNKVTCIREPVTGTRRRERICKTERQRLSEQAAAIQFREQLDNTAGMTPSRGYGGG